MKIITKAGIALFVAFSASLACNAQDKKAPPKKPNPNAVTCSKDKATLNNLCFVNVSVRENGKIRAAEFASGADGNIKKIGHTIVVQCDAKKRAEMMVLRDKQGLNYAGGAQKYMASAMKVPPMPDHTQDLANWLCEASYSTTDAKLIMFAK